MNTQIDVKINKQSVYILGVGMMIMLINTASAGKSNIIADLIITHKFNVIRETCSSNTDCKSCVNSFGDCGWCASAQQCLPGNQYGPMPGNFCLNTTTDNWKYGYCEEYCASHTGCNSCLQDLPCGWCADNGTCAVGTLAGPFYINCTNKNWTWFRSECNGAVTISIWVLIGLFATFFVAIIIAWVSFLIYKWRLHVIQRDSEPKAAFM